MNFISYFVFNLFIVCVFPKKEDSQTVCDLPFEPGFWQYYYENAAMMCYWNDWKSRDQVAHTQKTYNNGRFSREKRFWGIVYGRWYCVYKQAALIALGHELDT